MRIKDLVNTATKGYLAVDSASGSGKMDTSVIFNNFAGEFVENDTNAIINKFYVYDGELYKANENYSGNWDNTKFTKVSVSYFLETLPQSETNRLPLEDGFYITNGAKVSEKQASTSYKCVKYYGEVGDKFFICGVGASYGRLWATFDKDDNIVRVSNASVTKTWADQFVLTLENGEVGVVYNTQYSLLTDLEVGSFIRILNLCSNANKQSIRINAVEKIVNSPSQSTAYNFTASLGSRLAFYYKPKSLPFKFYLKKNTYEFDEYQIYLSDSSNVNPLTLWKNDVLFGDVITITEFPAGYDRLYFFRAGYTAIDGIDVDLVSYNLYSVNYKLEEVEKKIDKPYKGLKIVCFGDSITQFKYNGKGYPDYLGEMSEATIVNGAIGGTMYSLRGVPTATPANVSQAWRALDISYLVHAWCTNDWSIVDPCVQYLHDYDNRDYAPIITELKNNPVSTAEVVTIMAGTNDFSGSVSLGTSGSTDKSTVFGAINSIIQEILTTNPKIRLFMFSPTIRWYNYTGIATSDPDDFSDVVVRGGLTLKEFSAAVVGEIEKSHIPVCDMYNTLGWNKWDFNNYFLDTDGTHPYKGFKNIANRFYAFLKAFNN